MNTSPRPPFSTNEVNYAELYDGYWLLPDRAGASSIDEPDKLAREIVKSCGFGRYLDVGAGMGSMVRALLELGVDAHGADVSKVAVDSCNLKIPGKFHIGDARQLPFGDNSFDTVISTDCLEHLAEEDVCQCIAELWRVTRNNLYLRIATRVDRDAKWHLTVKNREWWEEQIIDNGFRRHPRYFDHNQYQKMGEPTQDIVFLGQKISENVMQSYSSDWLLENRGLHMDMGRETGARSDAHLIRYHWARQFIKSGDVVVDAACGLGYGSWLLKSCTDARTIVGLDQSKRAIDYCKAAFVSPDLTFVETELPEGLSNIKKLGVNAIVCFETLEHIADPLAFLQACWDILLPGGRIIVSVPHDWSDDTGIDPNPHHFHVYDWRSLKEQLLVRYAIDRTFAQTATRSKNEGKWQKDQRRLVPFDAEQEQAPISEWLLATAIKDPLAHDGQGYIDRRFPNSNSIATDFEKSYSNPWIAQNLVYKYARPNNPSDVSRACEQIISLNAHSVDVGAALCVLGYQFLEKDVAAAETRSFKKSVTSWLSEYGDEPHEIRWAISLLFLLGRMEQRIGQLDTARDYYLRCSKIDPLLFHPTIATKSIEADFRRGVISWSVGDFETAKLAWLNGINTAERVVKVDWQETFGKPNSFQSYILDEVGSCIRIAGYCSTAYRASESPLMHGRHLSLLFSQLAQSQPDPPRLTSDGQTSNKVDTSVFFASRKILQANKWCREVDRDGHIACNLHPTTIAPTDQPKWHIDLRANVHTRGIIWSAIAGNPSKLNNGVVIVIDLYDACGKSLRTRRFTLKPREKFNHWLDASTLENADSIVFMAICSPTAESISCAGVAIEIHTAI